MESEIDHVVPDPGGLVLELGLALLVELALHPPHLLDLLQLRHLLPRLLVRAFPEEALELHLDLGVAYLELLPRLLDGLLLEELLLTDLVLFLLVHVGAVQVLQPGVQHAVAGTAVLLENLLRDHHFHLKSEGEGLHCLASPCRAAPRPSGRSPDRGRS